MARSAGSWIAAPLLVGAAVGLRSLIVGPSAEPETNFLLVAVTAAALMGGLGPGLLAVAVAAFQEAWWQMGPPGTLAIDGARDRVELAVFVFTGVFISAVVDRLARARRREADAAAALRSKEEAFDGAVRLAVALQGSQLGAWDWVVGQGTATVSRRWRELVGAGGEGDETRLPFGAWMACIHPEDRPRVEGAVRGLADGSQALFDVEYRVARPGEPWAWVRSRATAVERNPDGSVRRVAGTLADVDARKRSESAAAERERRLQAYFDSPAVGIAITSPDKGWIEVNDRLCAMLGYTRDELRHSTWAELTHPDDLAADVAQFQRLLAGEIDRYALDKRFLHRDGTPIWTALSVSCARKPDGSVDFFVAILLDIGERKRAEEALRRSEDRFRTYVETAPLGIFVVDGEGRYRDFNQAALDLVRMDADALRARTIADMVEEPDQAAAVAGFAALLEKGHLEHDYRLRRGDGSHVWVALRATRLGDGSFMAFCQDISARKASEEVTRERERYLHTTLDTALDGFWAIDGEGRIVDVNPAYCAMTGYSRDELLTMRVADVEASETPAEAAAHIQRIRTQGFDRFTSCHRRKDGSLVHVLVSARFVDLGPGLNVCFLHDVTERGRAERALRESEQRYRTLVNGMASGLVLQSADGAILDSNPAAERLLGLTSDAMRGRTSLDPRWHGLREDGCPCPGEEHPPMLALRTGATQADRILGIHRPDGAVAWLSVTAQPLRDESGSIHAVLSTFVDVTERRAAEAERARLQAQLAHAARLAAMGTLVAGVAHEINNPLSALMSNSGTAAEEVRDIRRAIAAEGASPRPDLDRRFDELQEMLVDTGTAARRVADIVRDLTILGRPDQAKQPIDLGEVVRRAVDRLPPSVTRRVQVTCALEPVPPVAASAGQMEQVLANLVGNAALSAPADRTVNVQVGLRDGPDGTVRLVVSDDGPGIPLELQERIFEPFFTTRPLGTGTGLGLSICNAIVGAHDGTLTVASAPGRGATFTVEIPALPPRETRGAPGS